MNEDEGEKVEITKYVDGKLVPATTEEVLKGEGTFYYEGRLLVPFEWTAEDMEEARKRLEKELKERSGGTSETQP